MRLRVSGFKYRPSHPAEAWRTEGTFAGEGSTGGSEETPVSFTGNTIYRLSEGRIAELWNEWDNLRLLTAIGQAPDSSVAAD